MPFARSEWSNAPANSLPPSVSTILGFTLWVNFADTAAEAAEDDSTQPDFDTLLNADGTQVEAEYALPFVATPAVATATLSTSHVAPARDTAASFPSA